MTAGLVTRDEIAVISGVRVMTISCAKRAGSWGIPSDIKRGEYGLVFVRRGGFIYRAHGRSSYVDATTAYFEPAATDLEIGHNADGGDESTVIALPETEILRSVGEIPTPSEVIPTTTAIDLGHQALIVRVREGIDTFELQERLTTLLGMLAECSFPGRATTLRPQTEVAHRRIVEFARQAIAADPVAVDLGHLALDLGHTRFHVSRVFSRVTGTTLSRHRNRIRVALALDRLASGETNLAMLAADLGFADQSHMVRVIKGSVGTSPGALRRWFQRACLPPSTNLN